MNASWRTRAPIRHKDCCGGSRGIHGACKGGWLRSSFELVDVRLQGASTRSMVVPRVQLATIAETELLRGLVAVDHLLTVDELNVAAV